MVVPPLPVVGLLKPRDETRVDEDPKEDGASERDAVFILESKLDPREIREDEVDVTLFPFVEVLHPGAGKRDVAPGMDTFVSREDVDPPRSGLLCPICVVTGAASWLEDVASGFPALLLPV
jgi:hypothetical protein